MLYGDFYPAPSAPVSLAYIAARYSPEDSFLHKQNLPQARS